MWAEKPLFIPAGGVLAAVVGGLVEAVAPRGAGGGGGSGYTYTAATANQYPIGCKLDSRYYLTDASTTAGQNSGNGKARITLVE